jgi:hypothetical protein
MIYFILDFFYNFFYNFFVSFFDFIFRNETDLIITNEYYIYKHYND